MSTNRIELEVGGESAQAQDFDHALHGFVPPIVQCSVRPGATPESYVFTIDYYESEGTNFEKWLKKLARGYSLTVIRLDPVAM